MILALRERVRECSENSRSRHSIVRCCSCSVTRLLRRTRAWEFDIPRRVFELGSFLSRSPPRVRGASPAWPRLPHPPLVPTEIEFVHGGLRIFRFLSGLASPTLSCRTRSTFSRASRTKATRATSTHAGSTSMRASPLERVRCALGRRNRSASRPRSSMTHQPSAARR
jgi:hypothetical protein